MSFSFRTQHFTAVHFYIIQFIHAYWLCSTDFLLKLKVKSLELWVQTLRISLFTLCTVKLSMKILLYKTTFVYHLKKTREQITKSFLSHKDNTVHAFSVPLVFIPTSYISTVKMIIFIPKLCLLWWWLRRSIFNYFKILLPQSEVDCFAFSIFKINALLPISVVLKCLTIRDEL
jgi:hypothetical protein